jgi:DNA adenine methylase
MYYAIRDEYNQRNVSKLRMAALFIFLNRTCFNGLYRVNSKNLFNVPFGKYVNPKICDSANLRQVSDVLRKVEMKNGDYADLIQYVNEGCFIYLDPPYKPISETSAFNSYCAGGFDDGEQIRLKEFCDAINEAGATFMLSNSDPSSVNPENDFFDKLYSAYNIRRVKAKRNINSKAEKRGEINELLITNY